MSRNSRSQQHVKLREHFEYAHDLLFQQQHEIYVTTHQRRPTDKQQ